MPKRSSKPRMPDPMLTAIVEGVAGEKLTDKPAPPPEREKNPAAVALGKLGGLKGGPARAKKLSKKRLSLTSALHVPGGLFVTFADGRTGTVSLADLQLNANDLRLNSVRASASGSAAEIEDQRNHTIHIDSASLRALIDPEFAAELDAAIAAIVVAHSDQRNLKTLPELAS